MQVEGRKLKEVASSELQVASEKRLSAMQNQYDLQYLGLTNSDLAW